MPQESTYSLQMYNSPLVDYGYGGPSPQAAYRNSDIDFRDVFGGPPHGASVHDIRYSFTEGIDSVEDSGRSIGKASVQHPWTSAEEKPVFGEAESVNKRRYLREDFFDDIFKAGESPSSTPRHVFSSSPGSRVLSPARTNGSGCPSLPSQFSLPDKRSKGMELPTSGSTSLNSSKVDTALNRGSSLDPLNISVFGFSTQAQDDSKTDHPSYRPSPLSQQSSLRSQELDDSEVETQFHFSIYKWANQGMAIPMVMPLNTTKKSKNLKERQTFTNVVDDDIQDRSKQGNEASEMKLNQVCKEKTEFKPLHSVRLDEQDETGKGDSVTTGKYKEQQRTKKEMKNKDEVTFKKQDADLTVPNKKAPLQESQKPAGLESNLKRRGKNKVKEFIKIFNQETPSKPRSPNRPIGPESGREEEPTVTVEAATQQEKSTKSNVNGKKIKISKNVDVPKEADDSKPTTTSTNNPPSRSSATRQEKSKKSTVDGEKIKISKNVEVPKKEADGSKQTTTSTNNPPSRSSGQKETAATKESATQPEKRQKSAIDTEKSNMSKTVEVPPYVSDKTRSTTRVSQKEDSKFTTGTAKPPHGSQSSSGPTQKNTSTSSGNENIPWNATPAAGEADDDSSQTNFTIKELSEEEQKQGQATAESDEIQATDAKIRQWASGKEGNIRSLLTTLQSVLWPGSGWKPVALMNIIEGPGVKRAYQKAMLCLHPDKLQQKGASSHQRYIAEKVFDILQEAWDHFNTLGSL